MCLPRSTASLPANMMGAALGRGRGSLLPRSSGWCQGKPLAIVYRSLIASRCYRIDCGRSPGLAAALVGSPRLAAPRHSCGPRGPGRQFHPGYTVSAVTRAVGRCERGRRRGRGGRRLSDAACGFYPDPHGCRARGTATNPPSLTIMIHEFRVSACVDCPVCCPFFASPLSADPIGSFAHWAHGLRREGPGPAPRVSVPEGREKRQADLDRGGSAGV